MSARINNCVTIEDSDTDINVVGPVPQVHEFLASLTLNYPSIRIRNEYQEEGYDLVGIATYNAGIIDNRFIHPNESGLSALYEFSKEHSWFDFDSYLEDYTEDRSTRNDVLLHSWVMTYDEFSKSQKY